MLKTPVLSLTSRSIFHIYIDETNVCTYRQGLFIILIHDPRFDPKASLGQDGLGRVVIFTYTLTAL